jgi:hypothetical protein
MQMAPGREWRASIGVWKEARTKLSFSMYAKERRHNNRSTGSSVKNQCLGGKLRCRGTRDLDKSPGMARIEQSTRKPSSAFVVKERTETLGSDHQEPQDASWKGMS